MIRYDEVDARLSFKIDKTYSIDMTSDRTWSSQVANINVQFRVWEDSNKKAVLRTNSDI